MTLVRLRPTRQRHRNLWDGFDRTFQSLFEDDTFDGNTDSRRSWNPSMDLTENESGFILTAEIPGITEEDIDISLKENVLTITGEKAPVETDSTEKRPYYSERCFGQFKRTVRFHTEIEKEKISADYQNGVLTIFLPKSEDTMEKEIPISFKK